MNASESLVEAQREELAALRARLAELERIVSSSNRNALETTTDVARCRAFSGDATDISYSIDRCGTVTYVSAAVRAYGFQPEEIVSRSFLELVHPDDRTAAKSYLDQTITEGSSKATVYRFVDKRGQPHWFEDISQTSRDEKGLVAGVFGTLRDVTARVEGERRVRMALEGTAIGLWDWYLPTGEATFVNHWADILGYPPEETVNHVKMWEEHIHPEDKGWVMQAVKDHFDGRTPVYETVHRIRARSGEWHWFLDRGKVIERDALGKPLRAIGMHVDVTAHKLAEERLRESDAKYAALVEQSLDGVLIAQDGIFRFANKAIAEMLGYRTDELIGMRMADLIAPESRELVMGRYERRLAGEDVPPRYEFRLICRDGSIKDVEACASAIPYQGRLADMGTVRDVTERKRAEAGLRKAYGALEKRIEERTRELLGAQNEIAEQKQALLHQRMESLAVTGRLAAGVAHEINNPLQGIVAQLRLLADDVPAEVRDGKRIKLIHGSIKQIAAIVKHLLDLHREPQDASNSCCAASVIKDLTELIASQLAAHNIRTDIYVDPPDAELPLSANQFTQVLLNLILNAQDAMPQGGSVRIEARRSQNGSWIAVSDEGVGIRPEDRAKLFSPFYTTKGAKGTGLGLAVTHSILTAAGGTIDVCDCPEGGTTFVIHLPPRREMANGEN